MHESHTFSSAADIVCILSSILHACSGISPGFYFVFIEWSMTNMFSSAYLSSYIFYSKVSFRFFAHLLLFNLEFFHILWIEVLCQYIFCKYFLPDCSLHFTSLKQLFARWNDIISQFISAIHGILKQILDLEQMQLFNYINCVCLYVCVSNFLGTQYRNTDYLKRLKNSLKILKIFWKFIKF